MIRAIRRKLQCLGLRSTIHFLIQRLIHCVCLSQDKLYQIRIPGFSPDIPDLNREVKTVEIETISQLGADDRQRLIAYGGKSYLSLFDRRLKKQQRLFLSYVGNNIAGAAWVAIGKSIPFYIIPLQPSDVMFYATFTLDEFRRGGVSTATLFNVLNVLKSERFENGHIYTKTWNFQQKALEKLGFSYLGSFLEFNILGKTIMIWSNIHRRSLD